MKTFLVGGAVRDILLGLDPKDRDYVITGATSIDVENLIASGFEQVGADFPVFLHPTTGEEYALARLERKVAAGYNGFEAFTSPDLTIEDDLRRRDLTINAMAIDPELGSIVDPFGGQRDLKEGMLRHVSPAFAEDPLRVLRVARFAARYGFNVHPDTMKLMTSLVDSGELDHLTPERVWKEMEKFISEKHLSWGVSILRQCGAWDRLFGPDDNEEYEVEPLLDFICETYQDSIYDLTFILMFGLKDVKFLSQKMWMPKRNIRLLSMFKDAVFGLRRFYTHLNSDEALRIIKSLDMHHSAVTSIDVIRAIKSICMVNAEDTTWVDLIYRLAINIRSIDYASLTSSVSDKSCIPDTIRNAQLHVIRSVVYP